MSLSSLFCPSLGSSDIFELPYCLRLGFSIENFIILEFRNFCQIMFLGRSQVIHQISENAERLLKELEGHVVLLGEAILHDESHVRVHYGVKAVGDGEHGAVDERLSNRPLNERIRLLIDVRRRLVQQQNFVVPQNGSSETNELTLTDREITSTFRHHELQAIYLGLQLDDLERPPDLLVLVSVERVQVVANRRVEQHRILRNYGDFRAQALQIYFARVNAVNQNATVDV